MAGKREQRIAAALNEIRSSNRGRLTAAAVVEAARNPRHPLHREFQWDDKKAAQLQRLAQARTLITYVTITVSQQPHKITCPFYIRDPSLPSKVAGYTAINSDSITARDAQNIIIDEMQRIVGCVERARGVCAFLGKRFPSVPRRLQQLLQEAIDIRAAVERADGGNVVRLDKRAAASRRDQVRRGKAGMARRRKKWRGRKRPVGE
jgi:hypothetical protein